MTDPSLKRFIRLNVLRIRGKLYNLNHSHRFTYEVGRLNCYARGPITKDDTTKWAQFIFPPSMYVMLAIQAVVPIHRDLGQMEVNGI